MPVTKALDAYQSKRLNCAQSILHGFSEYTSVSSEEILAARQHGGGRAEQGRCGALNSALKLVESESHRDTLCDAFSAIAGSESCRIIRKQNRITCGECVELAAMELHQMLKYSPKNKHKANHHE
ncbi:MAG: hypothetical protein HN370_04060 [Phycisphaerales bacterium]|jgi:hypothetical protein|nr:hypothetical protein [Phycisphaerales bacterium]